MTAVSVIAPLVAVLIFGGWGTLLVVREQKRLRHSGQQPHSGNSGGAS